MAESGEKQSREEEEYDVVVVGAGLSGLTAANNILKKSPEMKLLVLEARDRVGGRTFTQPMKVSGNKTDMFDFGAMWVGPSQHHLLKTLRELNMETYPQYCEGTKFMQYGHGDFKTFDDPRPPLYSWWAWAEYNYFYWRLEQMAKKVPMEDPYSSELAYELEGLSVAALSRQYLWTSGARQAVDQDIKGCFGTDSTRLGAMSYLAYANSAGGMAPLYGTQDTAQDARIKEGAQTISKKLSEKVGKERVLLSTAVTTIDQTSEPGKVVIHCQHVDAETNIMDGPVRKIRAKKAIMTSPPNLVTRVNWLPQLNPIKKHLCDSLNMGHLYKAILTYEKPYWRNKGFSGEIFSTGGLKITRECSTGPVSECYDATSADGHPALVVFIPGRIGIEWTQKTEEERAEAVSNTLAQLFGPEMKSYIDYKDRMWGTDPWSGGCPVVYATPGTMISMPHLRMPHQNVHFGGTATAINWMGYMSGAIQSGERTALEVLVDLDPLKLSEEEKRQAVATRAPRGQFVNQRPCKTVYNTLLAGAAAACAAALYSVIF